MVRPMERVWVHADDKRLAKANASIHGMKIAEYIGWRIQEDAKVSREKMQTLSEQLAKEKDRDRKGRRVHHDWF